ncbi:hypothetical protein ACFL1H_04835 [Nanoarchaeota archaeon]
MYEYAESIATLNEKNWEEYRKSKINYNHSENIGSAKDNWGDSVKKLSKTTIQFHEKHIYKHINYLVLIGELDFHPDETLGNIIGVIKDSID